MEFDAGRALKKLDPIAYDLGKSEWLNCEVYEDGALIEIDSTYYFAHDVEGMLD